MKKPETIKECKLFTYFIIGQFADGQIERRGNSSITTGAELIAIVFSVGTALCLLGVDQDMMLKASQEVLDEIKEIKQEK